MQFCAALPGWRFVVVLLVACPVGGGQGWAEPLISEFMAANTRTLADEDGAFSDWIEIHNPAATPLNLQGYFLSDDPARLTKWAFPSVTVAPGGYLVVFASGKNRVADPARLHANFQLNAGGDFLALVKPDGVTLAGVFSPEFPNQKDDVAYGIAQNAVVTPLLANASGRVLVPASAPELASDWAQPEFEPPANWLSLSAPPAIGYDTNQATATLVNLARGGVALQSTTLGNNAAPLAIDGSTANYTATLATDNAPFWQVRLASEAAIHRIVLRNRTGCCQSRLRDITVEILAGDGAATNFVSPLLNPENRGFTYPAGPPSITVDVAALAGGPLLGNLVRVRRTPDPDLSGSSGQGTADEAAGLSLGEVEVLGVALAEVNLARTGTPAPTASQSSTSGSFSANLAINGDLTDFSHTLSTNTNAIWTLNLGRRAVIKSVTLHNRDSCCGSRLRDITVQILDPATNLLYASPLLNPENAGYVYPNGPEFLHLDLSAQPVLGQFVRVRRTSDPDLSGTGGLGNPDEANVLSLGEVIVRGFDVNGYRPFIRADLQGAMLGKNASAFLRLPFGVNDPARLSQLMLRLRYDDGFIAYLNGVKVAERNAPAAPAWDSTAPIKRDVAEGISPETIDLTAALPRLVTGTNVLALHALNVRATDANFLLQPELTSTHIVTSDHAYLVDATPGARNESEYYLGEVADTQFSVNRGFFDAPFALEITSPTPGAAVYYSFDGSEPKPGTGLLYTGPITITNTAIVRARAFKDGYKPTDVDTHTYVFLNDVIYQAPSGAAPPYFPASWGANTVNYGMDPNVVSKFTLADWREALTQIPSISLVTEMKHLFDPATGIYANALQHGIDWERPGSIELLDPTNRVAGRFQENCGLRIRGGYSRNPSFVKHSFRVFFRAEYGAPQLHYPLFEDDGANEFDTFDLRTSQNYAWPRESDYNAGRHDSMVREVWCRETLGAMGQPYRRSRYYHLYLNGQYWGLYETDERPEASYGATYLGGNKDEYDVVKCANHVGGFVTEVTDGNFGAWSNLWRMCLSLRTNSANSNYFRILGRNPDGTRNPALPVMLDVDNLIDYMLGIFYAGDGDATLSAFLSDTRPNNWFGMRNRNNPDRGFVFFNSDCEHTLGAPSWREDRTGPWGGVSGSNIENFTYSNPQYFHEELMLNAEYRLLFADHAHRHCFNGGVLTPASGTNRWYRKAQQITKAIRAYSARWGDAVREPPYGETEWTNIIAEVPRTFFPTRTATVLNQLRTDRLYPNAHAPSFSQHGGEIPSGFALNMTHTNATGLIYYTLDGSDPRQVGGAASGAARVFTNALILEASTRVKARVLAGTNWSALNQADFVIAGALPLRITEIMFNPAPVSPAEAALGFRNSDDFEFIELRNVGSHAMNLAGVTFANGISFTFAAGFLAPGERIVVVKNEAAFRQRYGASARLGGVFGGNLANGGERLRLQDALGRVLHDFSYADHWYPVADGLGFALVVVDDTAPPGAWGLKASWRQSSALGGSPGEANPAPPAFPLVVVNELLPRPAPGDKVRVELANAGGSPADVSGWWLSDDFASPKKFRLPPNTVLLPGGFVVFGEDDFGSAALGTNALHFSATGGETRLFSADAPGELTGYCQGWDFGVAEEGVSFGRHVISTGADHFVAQTATTLGAPNAGPRTGPLVIAEIMYRPPDLGVTDNSQDEFVEVFNTTDQAVPLFAPDSPTNTWRVTGGIDLVFPTNLSLVPRGYLLIVNFNPETDAAALTAFRALHGLADSVPIVGPYAGKLDNSGDDVELKQPSLLPTGLPVWVQMDRVSYRDAAPWPAEADGYGLSLQRRSPSDYGNDPAYWIAAPPTAAHATRPPGQVPVITEQPAGQLVPTGRSVTLSVRAEGPGVLRYQWRANGTNIVGAVSASLLLANAQPAQSGQYEVIVFNDFGGAVSQRAMLIVSPPPRLVGLPQAVAVRPGANTNFTVVASSSRPIFIQWRFNGVILADATNNVLALTNVQLAQRGTYSVEVTDDLGSTATAQTTLTLLIDPVIVQQPLSVTVPQGANVTLSVAITNTATLPITYRWRRSGSTVATVSSHQYVNFFTATNVQTTTNFSVVVTNAARSAGFLSSNVLVTVSADTDRDGLPDDWETAWGFNPNDPADAAADSDGDGSTNRQEYEAGTEHTNALSVLKVERIAMEGGTTRCEFLARSNRTYTLEFKESFTAGRWTKLADFEARSTNRLEVWPDLYPTTASRLYRLITPRQADPTNAGPTILQSPQSVKTQLGENARFSVTAAGQEPLSYQWRFNDQEVTGATVASLEVTDVQVADGGGYSVRVMDARGATTSESARLSVAPRLEREPQDQTVLAGQTVTFEVSATGAEPLAYRWYHDARPLSGATNASLVLPNAQLEAEGSYWVVVGHITPTGREATASRRAKLSVRPNR